jgi:hypothetical protein
MSFEGEKRTEKKAEKLQWYISRHCPDDPSHLTKIKVGKVGGMNEVSKRTMCGAHQLISAGS